jgi:uncharacterized protein (TIGR03437 family)
LLVFTAAGLHAQFSGLSSTADGSALYFESTLRLKGAPALLNGKIYLEAQGAVSLYRSQQRAAPPANSPPCGTGGFSDYLSAETAANGIVALAYRANANGGCSYPPNTLFTQLTTPSGDTSVAGVARLSPEGRHALVFLAATARPGSSFTLSYLDLETGARTPVSIAPPMFPQFAAVSSTGGRVIANDGTAILGTTDGSTHYGGYLITPTDGAQAFPVADALPVAIDAAGAKVVYQRQGGVYLLDLHSLTSTTLIPAGQAAAEFRMSDDGWRLLYNGGGQVHVVDTATGADRALTNAPAAITDVTISGDGKIAYAVTGVGRLLKISVDDGSTTEVIGHTPYLLPYNPTVMAGFTAQLFGSGLADTTINGTVPLQPWLGNATMWIGERKVPLIQLAPASVTFLVPWDIQPAGGTIRILTETPGDQTPFYFPEVEATVTNDLRAGAIARQDWSQTYVGPVNTGEIIHVFASGFGPVAPEVTPGAAAPAAEPLARITQTLTCSNAEILYAGLAPYAVERTYQIDIRIGPTPGYQKFICSLGGGTPFDFLTLNVVP